MNRFRNAETLSQSLKAAYPVPYNADAWTQEGYVYFGGGQVAAAAGEWARVQLYNPASSGREFLVDEMRFGFVGGSVFRIYRENSPISAAPGNIISASTRNARAHGQIWEQSSPTNVVDFAIQFRGGANDFYVYAPAFPIILLPGEGLVIHRGLTEQSIDAGFTWRELDR